MSTSSNPRQKYELGEWVSLDKWWAYRQGLGPTRAQIVNIRTWESGTVVYTVNGVNGFVKDFVDTWLEKLTPLEQFARRI